MTPEEEKAKRALEQREKEEGTQFDEPSGTDEPKKSLGKVQTAEQKQQEARKKDFEERVKSDLKADVSQDLTVAVGYIALNLEDLPSQGRFYPKNTSIQIKPATGRELEHWTTMNEANPIDVDTHFKDMIKSCMKIKVGSRPLPFGQLLEADKLYILLSIQDKTFDQGENQINLKMKCTLCGTDNKKKLEVGILEASSDSDEVLERYYDESLRRYVIKTKSYGEIDLFPPTIGTMDFIYKYVQEKTESGQYYNKALMGLLPYLIEDYSDMKEELVLQAEMDFTRWDKKKISLIYDMVTKIKIGVKPSVHYNCTNCGSAEEAPVNFPDGPKSLFLIQDFEDELL